MKPISGKKMCRILERRGWIFVRSSSSHQIYKHADHRDPISVPVHGNRDMPTGTQKDIMRDAGLVDDDL